jgi:DNA-binding NarL/FixJ family response regulator
MVIEIYISNRTLKKWFLSIIREIDLNHDYVIHDNLEALYSSLILIKSKRVMIIDVEDKLSLEYFKTISLAFDNVFIIAIGLNKPIEQVIHYFSIGLKGFIDLNFTSIEFYQIINKVSNGSKYLSIAQQEELLNYLSEKPSLILNNTFSSKSTLKNVINTLTDKEKRVCELLIKGMTYKEIASATGVTSFSINQKVKSIFKKLDVRSRSELSYRYLS